VPSLNIASDCAYEASPDIFFLSDAATLARSRRELIGYGI